MFKKIHSNSDPEATIATELKKEFGKYFTAAEARSVSFLNTYPKEVFFVMVVVLALSATICFIVYNPSMREKEKMRHRQVSPSAIGSKALDQTQDMLQEGETLSRMYELKSQIRAILSKPKLNHSDSLILRRNIAEIEQAGNTSTQKQ